MSSRARSPTRTSAKSPGRGRPKSPTRSSVVSHPRSPTRTSVTSLTRSPNKVVLSKTVVSSYQDYNQQPEETWDSNAKFKTVKGIKILQNPEEVFMIEKKLGEGGFGAVYKVIGMDDQPYALKILKEADPQILKDEIGPLIKLSNQSGGCNPDMVCYIDSFMIKTGLNYQDDNNYTWEGPSTYGILTEYIDGVDLDKCRRSRGYNFMPGEVVWLANWLASVLATMHQQNYIHRDLKPGNVMITYDGTPKLIDFGLSCFIKRYGGRAPLDVPVCEPYAAGTQGYVAPEFIDGSFKGTLEDYKKTDVFSFGVTLYDMLTGGIPYDEADTLSPSGFQQYVGPYKNIGGASQCLNNIIKQAVNKNPKFRPTMEEIVDQLSECQSQSAARVPVCKKPAAKRGTAK